MGFTHYWQRGTELPASAFAAAVEDCRTVLANTGIALAGFEGRGSPVIRDDVIVFNGPLPGSCESFEIHQTQFDRHGRNLFWSYCKTEHLPYDVCVLLALIVLKRHLRDSIRVTSDDTDGDWADARSICQETLGYGESFRLQKDEQ